MHCLFHLFMCPACSYHPVAAPGSDSASNSAPPFSRPRHSEAARGSPVTTHYCAAPACRLPTTTTTTTTTVTTITAATHTELRRFASIPTQKSVNPSPQNAACSTSCMMALGCMVVRTPSRYTRSTTRRCWRMQLGSSLPGGSKPVEGRWGRVLQAGGSERRNIMVSMKSTMVHMKSTMDLLCC